MFPSPDNQAYGIFVLQQVKALSDRGHQVEVISPVPYVPEAVAKLLNRKPSKTIPKKNSYGNITVYYPRYLSLPRPETQSIVAHSFRRTLQNHRELFESSDIINAHVALPDGFGAVPIARELDIPLVTTIHGADIYKSVGNPLSKRQIQSVFDKSDSIIMVSNQLLSDARDEFNSLDKSTVIYNGIPKDKIQSVTSGDLPSEFSKDRLTVTTVGTLFPRKGHKTVIDALEELSNDIRPNYLIMSDGEYRRELEAYTLEKEVDNQVHFAGYIPDHKDVLASLKASDVMAMPSTDEAFGIAYLEAMGCGTPAIGCRGEGPSDFITDRETGFLVPPHDAEAVADILRELHQNRELKQYVADRGQRAALNAFSWERNAQLVEQVFIEAMRENDSS